MTSCVDCKWYEFRWMWSNGVVRYEKGYCKAKDRDVWADQEPCESFEPKS